jgi:hypothetical protein
MKPEYFNTWRGELARGLTAEPDYDMVALCERVMPPRIRLPQIMYKSVLSTHSYLTARG